MSRSSHRPSVASERIDGKACHIPGGGSVHIDSHENVVWSIGGVPFFNGRAEEIFISQAGDRVYRRSGSAYFASPTAAPDWAEISGIEYDTALVLAGGIDAIARPKSTI